MKNEVLDAYVSRITDSCESARRTPVLARQMEAIKDSGLSIVEQGIEAQLLLNFKNKVMDRINDSAEGVTRGQQVATMADFGPFVPEVLPVITAWYPEFPLRDLVSVQSMAQDLAYIITSELVTGTNKAPTLVGQIVENPMGQRKINGYYPTGVIMGEQIPGNQLVIENGYIVGAVNYYALKTTPDYLEKFKLVVDINGTKTTYRSNGVVGGDVLLKNAETGAAVDGARWDIQSGGFYLPTTETTAENISIVANYVWNLDYAVDENIPKVKEQMKRTEMRAEPQALAMQWTIFAEALKKSQFKKDIRLENTKRVLDLLYQYQVRYILDDMYENALGAEATISIPETGIYNVEVASQRVMNALKQQATNIEYASGRMEGNRLVVGRNFKNWLESLPNTLFKPVAAPDGFSSPREIGTYGSFKVYFDPRRGDDEGFITYRGSQWYDSAYYLGVFLPIVPMDAVAINVTVRQAFASMVAYKFDKPTCVIPLRFTTEAVGA